MMAIPRLRPQDALLEQSRTVLGWLQGLAPEAFERPTVLPGWSVRQLAGHLVLVHTGLAQSLDQPTREPALPIHEFVKRYRRDVEMITAATLEVSADLSGPEVVAQLESAIDDLASQARGGRPDVASDQYQTRSDHDRGLPCDSHRRANRPYRRPEPLTSRDARQRSCIEAPSRAVPARSPASSPGSIPAVPSK